MVLYSGKVNDKETSLWGGSHRTETTNEPVTQQNSFSLFCPDLQTGEQIIWRAFSTSVIPGSE